MSMITLNPNRVNIPSGSAGKASDRRRTSQEQESHADIRPTRAHVNYIPAPEALMTLIRSAVGAFRRGVTWDRGSILNLLV